MLDFIAPPDPALIKASRKCERYLSSMRTNLHLMDKSPKVSTFDLKSARIRTCSFLDRSVLNYPPELKALRIEPGMPLALKKERLGIERADVPSDEELRFQAMGETFAHKARKASWAWRIGQEAEMLDRYDWYPFFITLTLDPDKIWHELGLTRPQFWQETHQFQYWLKRVAAIAAKSMGHKPPHKTDVPQSQYVRYVGVLEHGKSREHDHMHLLVWMRDIPDSWKNCPNRRIRNPLSRRFNRCRALESLWRWDNGLNSPAMYWRHQHDVWHRKHQFAYAVAKNGKPMVLRPAKAAGSYLCKYILKGDKTWSHRVKATRGLGLTMIRDLLWRTPPKILEALTWRPESYNTSTSLLTIHSVPHVLLRQLAKSALFTRKYEQGQLGWMELLQERSGSYSRMLSSVRNGAKPWAMPSPQLYDWVSQHLDAQAGYCEKRLLKAHRRFGLISPPEPFTKTKAIGGNRI